MCQKEIYQVFFVYCEGLIHSRWQDISYSKDAEMRQTLYHFLRLATMETARNRSIKCPLCTVSVQHVQNAIYICFSDDV